MRRYACHRSRCYPRTQCVIKINMGYIPSVIKIAFWCQLIKDQDNCLNEAIIVLFWRWLHNRILEYCPFWLGGAEATFSKHQNPNMPKVLYCCYHIKKELQWQYEALDICNSLLKYSKHYVENFDRQTN